MVIKKSKNTTAPERLPTFKTTYNNKKLSSAIAHMSVKNDVNIRKYKSAGLVF